MAGRETVLNLSVKTLKYTIVHTPRLRRNAAAEGKLNNLHSRNQRLVAAALSEPLLITSIDVSSRRIIGVKTSPWRDYWEGCDALGKELSRLHAAWLDLIDGGYSAAQRSPFVHAYFVALRAGLSRYLRGELNLFALRKLVGFETLLIAGEHGERAAGVFSIRNPVYLLSRIALPNAPEDPKFLPLICPLGGSPGSGDLFCHYRRICISEGHQTQLFVYPPREARYRWSSYRLIGELFASLTTKNHPWVRSRSRLLFEGVFAELVAPPAPRRIRLLDVACGSAKTTMALCRKAFAKHRTSFDLTLVDVVRGASSIANAFHRHPRVFRHVVFRHESFFDWVSKVSSDCSTHFDVALMLRVGDVFASFRIEELSWHEAAALLRRDRVGLQLDPDVTRPAKLLENNKLDRLQQRLWRSAFRRGTVFHQFSLSDYFGAIQVVLGGEVSDNDRTIHAPVRRFDEGALVLASGRSLIGELMTLADRIVVEDADLSASRLRKHIAQFGLKGLCVADTTDRRGGRGASVSVIIEPCIANERRASTGSPGPKGPLHIG